tara:strand:- start:1880 stop:2101 length:222 start_codon:yes stop_codon:yes gene_type:complete
MGCEDWFSRSDTAAGRFILPSAIAMATSSGTQVKEIICKCHVEHKETTLEIFISLNFEDENDFQIGIEGCYLV